MSSRYSVRTHYSNHFTTWIKRIVLILGIIMVSAFWIFADDEYDSWWFIMPALIVIFLGLLFSPVDDFALSEKEFFFLKTSPLAFLSKAERFDISQMKSIEYTVASGSDDRNRDDMVITITFKDGSVRSMKTGVLRKDVELYMEKVRAMIIQ